MKLETIGRILASGFGDRVLSGIIIGALDGVTPYRCYEYIKDDIKVFHWASDSDWRKYRRMAKGARVGNVTDDDVTKELQKHRPDILGVILNHPKGRDWLHRQLVEMKQKLEI